MYKFAIRNENFGEKNIAFLYYNEINKEYEIEIPEDTESQEAPLIIAHFIKKNAEKSTKTGVFDGFRKELLRLKDKI